MPNEELSYLGFIPSMIVSALIFEELPELDGGGKVGMA
jgi:hypothetical protein